MDLRSYSRAKQVYDSTPMDKRPNNPAIRLVSQINMEIAKEKIDKFNENK